MTHFEYYFTNQVAIDLGHFVYLKAYTDSYLLKFLNDAFFPMVGENSTFSGLKADLVSSPPLSLSNI